MPSPSRLVVFSGNLNHAVRRGIIAADNAVPGLEWLVLVERPARSPLRHFKLQLGHLKRNGIRWLWYQATRLPSRVRKHVPAPVQAGEPGWAATPQGLRSRPNLSLVTVEDLHGAVARERLRAFAPDLGLALAAPILRPELFGAPKLGTVNLHKGKLPEFRGMPPAFWELWSGQPEVGCTVHWVDATLDTGDVVAKASLRVPRFPTVRGMQLQLDEAGVAMVAAALPDLLLGRGKRTPQAGSGTTHTRPTLRQVAELDHRLARRLPATAPSWRRVVKGVRSDLAWAAWRGGLGRGLDPRITVLLYHRISDDARDDLTVGIAQFERQMALIRSHCQPLSLEQVLAGGAIPRSKRPLVAVTFDDGYEDNFTNAMPILLRHTIPAAFFVSTGIVGTSRPFPHDVARGNPPIPSLTWDQVRRMQELGFTIGSHTVSHIDCAAEPESRVREELAQSRADLARELGQAGSIFAYPYGGRGHMSPERLALVREAGFSACLSGYRGANTGVVDPYDVRRRGIHWEYSDRSFLYECLGL